MIEKITYYVTRDGIRFNSEDEAEKHEAFCILAEQVAKDVSLLPEDILEIFKVLPQFGYELTQLPPT